MKHLKLKHCVLLSIATVTVIAACGGNDPAVEVTKGTVFTNATVVNPRDGSTLTGMAVVVDAGKITNVVPMARLSITSPGVTKMDIAGKYVVPGYLDMHTHLFDFPDVQRQAGLMVVNGITGVREMRGSADEIVAARQLSADNAAGKVVSPEVLAMAGPIIGVQVIPPSRAASDAVAEVQKEKAYGVDFIKVLSANRDATLALISEAKNQGIYVAGHLSVNLSARDSSNAGWRGVEHNLNLPIDCSTQEDAIRAAKLAAVTPPVPAGALTPAENAQMVDTYSEAKCIALAQTFVKNNTWSIPTLYRIQSLSLMDAPTYQTDPNLQYVSKATLAGWKAATANYSNVNPQSTKDTNAKLVTLMKSLSKLLKQNNVKMLAGSDTSLIAPWVVPGFSLHQEFSLLQAAGLTPLQILQMTTINGAEFMHRESTMGTVDAGKNADLVILNDDPLASVANLSKISGVVLRGRYLAQADLDKIKSDTAAYYASQPVARVLSVSAILAHTD